MRTRACHRYGRGFTGETHGFGKCPPLGKGYDQRPVEHIARGGRVHHGHAVCGDGETLRLVCVHCSVVSERQDGRGARKPAAQRIEEVLEEQSDITSPENAVKTVKDGSIDFDHVTFAYQQRSGKPVLSDIDLHIQSGETIGIMGGTGSSKSSLVNLISRLYDVTCLLYTSPSPRACS